MFRSIRARLVLSYVAVTLLAVSLVGVLALSLLGRYIEQQERQHLTANAQAVARQAQSLLWPVIREHELRALAQTSAFLGNARVRILDPRRRVVADSGLDWGGDEFLWILPPLGLATQVPGESLRPLIVALLASKQTPFAFLSEGTPSMLEQLPPGTALTYVRRWEQMWGSRFDFEGSPDQEPVPRSTQVISVPVGRMAKPVGYVEISDGPDLRTAALRTARRAFLFAGVGATLAAVAIGLVVSRGLSAPVRQLTTVAGQMSSGNLSTRAPVRGRDEIGQLARQFNHMAERLEGSFAELAAERDALRRFVADASHELRTPITALKTFNDLLQGPAADDPAARSEFLSESQTQLERLQWITSSLLDLSRLDGGLVALELERHDVGELLEASAAPFHTLAAEQRIALSLDLPTPPVELVCDRRRVQLALSNLLDNALKFTPPRGEIEIGAEPSGQMVQIWVRDTGCGIAPADRPHIFQRFYRGREAPTTGSGLGLAIVRSVVEAHGGHVSVQSEEGAGSLFLIELPTRPTPEEG